MTAPRNREAATLHWTEQTVPCGLCDTPTRMLGTKRCDRCWELESRIHADPTLAREILARLEGS